MYGGSTGAACAITMTLGTDSLASWAYALLAKAIITVETIPDTHLEIACMSRHARAEQGFIRSELFLHTPLTG
jgi:hypothetical protein